jgi:hypothetical protein
MNKWWIYTGIFMMGFWVAVWRFGTDNKPLFSQKNIIFTLSGGTFDQNSKVIITNDTLLALKYVREQGHDTTITKADFESRGICFFFEDYSPIMWLPSIPVTPEETAIANHELMHLTVNIMNWAGVPLTEESEEAYAYELQYLSNQFYQKIK